MSKYEPLPVVFIQNLRKLDEYSSQSIEEAKEHGGEMEDGMWGIDLCMLEENVLDDRFDFVFALPRPGGFNYYTR